jgi:hypothetical protein
VLLYGWIFHDQTFDGSRWSKGWRRYPGEANHERPKGAKPDCSGVLFWIACELRREGATKEFAEDVLASALGAWHGGDEWSWTATPQDILRQIEDAWAQNEPRARPLACGFLLPHGFVLEGDWIYRWRRPPAPAAARVFRQLVRIARRLVDPDSKDHFLEVAWGKEVVPVLREDALFGRLSWLANRGGPFTALNAKDTTVYMVRAEEANADRLPLTLSLDPSGLRTTSEDTRYRDDSETVTPPSSPRDH